MIATRKHERAYADIRTHLRSDHGVSVSGTVRLSTFLRHRALHRKGVAAVPHVHEHAHACGDHAEDGLCPDSATHGGHE